MPRTIPAELQDRAFRVLELIASRSPRHASQALRLKRAPAASFRLLGRRIGILYDNSRPEAEYSEAETTEIGGVLVDLSRWSEEPRPGPTPQGRDTRLMLYLSDTDAARLARYCEREGCPRAEAVRRALRLLEKT